MANQNASRDGNSVTVMLGTDDVTGETREILVDSLGRLLVSDGTTVSGWATGGNTVGSALSLGTLDAFSLPIITNSTTRFTVSASASTLTGTSTTIFTNDSGNISLDSATTGTVSIGTGTSGAGKSVIVGSNNGTNGLSLRCGTGNMFVGATIADTATITMGGSTQTGTITIGASSNTQTVSIAAGTGATTLNLGVGSTTAKTINIGNGTSTGSVITIGGSSTLTSTIIQGSIKNTVTITATDLTLTNAHNVVITTAAVTITLPAVDSRLRYTIKNTAASSTTIATTGGVTIDGSATATLTQNQFKTVICDGTNWLIIG